MFEYDQFAYLTNVTDALGRTTGYTFDDNGNRLTERRQRTLASGSTQTLWSTNIYDAANRVLAVVEPDGFTNRTTYETYVQERLIGYAKDVSDNMPNTPSP